MALAAKAGCIGVFIGFETPTPEGLRELGKKFNHPKGRNLCASVRRIQRHGILVAGSFIIGLDIDEPCIGKRITEVTSQYGVDNFNALFLTPVPGTRLWDRMKSDQDFSKMHRAFCQWFVKTIRLAKTDQPSSYGHAAKVIDLSLKVYVYYCKMLSPAKAQSLLPRLNGAIDTPILRHLFKKLENIYGKACSPHYLWTIKMIDREDYDLLQKVIRQHIKDFFDVSISPVQYDDIMWRQINR